jgi:hypothetical protein
MSMTNGRDMSRAEKFEDEKKRIIESCFNKRDEDGSCEPPLFICHATPDSPATMLLLTTLLPCSQYWKHI